jgi:LuxR family transcriptional regulator, activator of conjugal transfer of Ti plasmids
MHKIFTRFVDHVHESSDISALHTALRDMAAALDLHTFAYLLTPRRSTDKTRLISNYPSSWTAHYLSNRYEMLDPVIVHAAQDPEPFEWGRELRSAGLLDSQRRFFDEAAQFGIRSGFTIPIHDARARVAAITFAADERHATFDRCIEMNRSVLQLIAIFFHSSARQVLAPDRTLDGILLAPRECECLEWAAKGKTNWEIGRILGITRKTVAGYLDSARNKLGAATRSEAVARLMAAKRKL